MIGIYKITSPKGKIYIGQSTNIKKRFKSYKKSRTSRQPRLFKSMYKYGYKNHCFEVVLECTKEELNNLERHYQDYYNVLGKKGLNSILIAGNGLKAIVSKKTRSKISASGKGRIPVNRKKVVCTSTNKIYISIKECAIQNNISYSHMKAILRGVKKNYTNFKYL